MVCLNCGTDILSFVLFCDECYGLIHNYGTYARSHKLILLTDHDKLEDETEEEEEEEGKTEEQEKRRLKNRRREGECEYVQRERRRIGWFQPFKHTRSCILNNNEPPTISMI